MTLSNTLLRKIPAHLIEGVAAGEYQVYGSIIRSVGAGRIIGHLQETSGFATAALNLTTGGVGNIAAQAIGIVQNEQIKSAIATVQSLQIAQLVASGVSIGVSMAGTAIVLHRLRHIEAKLDAAADNLAKISEKIDELKTEWLAKDMDTLAVLVEQVDEAWSQECSNAEWIAIARDAHTLQRTFLRRSQDLLVSADPMLAEPFVAAYSLASDLRVSARIAAGQDNLALQTAAERTGELAKLVDGLSSFAISASLSKAISMEDQMTRPEWVESLNECALEGSQLVERLRGYVLSAAAQSETLAELGRRQISGKEWIEAARLESEVPFLYLPTRASDI